MIEGNVKYIVSEFSGEQRPRGDKVPLTLWECKMEEGDMKNNQEQPTLVSNTGVTEVNSDTP